MKRNSKWSNEYLERFVIFVVPGQPQDWITEALELIELDVALQMRDEVRTKLVSRIAELQATIKRQDAEIGALRQWVVELEAAQIWQPIVEGAIDKSVTTFAGGRLIFLDDEDGTYLSLPDDLRLCRKVQP